jgi:CRISPR/Cas system-associated protein Cas5 (RAMP superfamily)
MIGLIGMLIRAAALGWEAVGNELDEKVVRWWNRR